MHPNADLVHRFYRAFAARDAMAMTACYSDDVVFEDPAFGELHGIEAKGMWHMLCAKAKDLKIEASAIQADDGRGSAHWEAIYTFSQTGRRVHNRIDASFRFRDGLICEHRDRFDFWAWSRQALGPAGLLLGWTPLLRNKVRGQANANLQRYLESLLPEKRSST
jgi:ketosteroid isomerase-like protein